MSRTRKVILAGTLLGWLMVGAVQAATITGGSVDFTNLVAGDSLKFFDVDTTAIDLNDNNKLVIGLSDFLANGTASPTAPVTASDTLTMRIVAHPGFFITSVDYAEGGSGQTTNGVASATASLVADSIPRNLPIQFFSLNTGGTWETSTQGLPILINNKTSIDVSIVNSLFAVAFGSGDIAQISKTSASLTVGVAPIPLPAAVWLFGSALIGFVSFSGRRLS